MSEDIKNETGEKEKKVLVTPDDVKAAFEFWNQYDIPVMPGLKEAFDGFCQNPTWENQEHLKYMLVKAISTTNHVAFTDEAFKKVTNQCADMTYAMEFERDLEETLAEETK